MACVGCILDSLCIATLATLKDPVDGDLRHTSNQAADQRFMFLYQHYFP